MNITASRTRRSSRTLGGRSLAIRAAFAAAIVVAVFFGVLPRLADWSEAGHHAASMGGLDIATLGVLAIVSVVTYAFVLTAVMPGLSLAQAVVVNQSSTAVANTMPAGGIGVLELGLAGALIAAGGVHAEVVAAVLVYRTVSLLLPLPVGAITYVIWRCNSRWRRAPGSPSLAPAWRVSP
jgi:uncharacterized membrane protein YbhN (UPF0104 family)